MNKMKISTSVKIDSLNKEIQRRPTFLQVISMAGICIGVVITLFTFITGSLLSNQSDKITAETKLVVAGAMNKHSLDEDSKWVGRKKDIINEVLAFLGLK